MTSTAAALLLALLTGAGPAADAGGPADDVVAAPRMPSLLGAEPLHGGSAALAQAGFSTLGVVYGQGVTTRDDLGLALDLDWSTTELLLSGFWRRPVATVGSWQLAGRLGVGWYLDFGGRFIHDDNRADRGIQLAPALLLSTRAGEGLVSVAGELPFTITTWHGGGFFVAPKVSAGYEAPLYGDLSLGLKAGLAWRGGGGDAPMRTGRVLPELLVLLGYRVF
ncbi:MAG TPA: hypothetical protein VFP50_09340 [Anaeromyxobacteraceae bacterium]|nr:hypothetical protein [Anaeromyxobacteraceae bacterium]